MHITLQDRPVRIELTAAAERALAARATPLTAEMELYFSCLIRKQVRFRESPVPDAVRAGVQLYVCFHPVMTERCGVDYEGDEPPLTDFPIARPEAFVPAWLRIDYHGGRWQGEFGFA